MNLLTIYWRPIAAAGLAIVLVLFGYYKGYEHEKARYDEHLRTDATLVAVAKAENDRRLQEAQAITNNITKEYADAVAKINDYYKSHPHIVRLCNSTTSSTMSTTSESSSGINEASSRASETTTEIDLQIAAKEVAQCQALIEFEKEQDRVQ